MLDIKILYHDEDSDMEIADSFRCRDDILMDERIKLSGLIDAQVDRIKRIVKAAKEKK
jgi:hypothetical protein